MITLRLTKRAEKEILAGCPWVMRHQLVSSSEWEIADPGSLARLETVKGEHVGIGFINPISQIVFRLLSRKSEPIDTAFFSALFSRALAKREAHYTAPYYRLVHSEADFLPGLVVDRYGDILVLQVTSAGMERLQAQWLPALDALIHPTTILLRNDISVRKLEGLSQEVRVLKGEVPPLVEVIENDCIYLANLREGQKTGWFYDMRDNRKIIAERCKHKTVLDVFSHSGGFGLLAAKQGATSVTMVEGSQLALDLAAQAAAKNGVLDKCSFIKGDAVAVMQKLAAEGKRYDVVITDPPAYVKAKKDVATGMKGYGNVAMAAAPLVVEGGEYFTASCSHHATRGAFHKAVLMGLQQAGKKATIISEMGAAKDHPQHAHLPQNNYLKGLLLKMHCN